MNGVHAQSMTSLLAMRALFGVAMGGEWGIGSALTMETIPPSARGFVSGLLQAGYPSGYFLASLAVYLFYDRLGWRYMFALGVVPAFLVYFIRRESTSRRHGRSASIPGAPACSRCSRGNGSWRCMP